MIIKNLLLNFIVAIYFLNFIRWELKKIMRQNPDEIEYIKDSIDGMVITFTNAAAKYYNSLVLNSRINYDRTKLIHIDAKFFVNETQQYRIGNLTNYRAEVEINNQRRIGRLYQASETQIKLFKAGLQPNIFRNFYSIVQPFLSTQYIFLNGLLLPSKEITVPG